MQERVYIQRLHDSTSDNIKTLDEALAVHTLLENSQRDVLRILGLSDLSPENEKTLSETITAVAFWRAIDLDTEFIDGLVSSGKIEIIQNYDVQAALVKSSKSAKTVNSQLAHFRLWYATLQPGFLRIIGIRTNLSSQIGLDSFSLEGVESALEKFHLDRPASLLQSTELKSILSVMLAARVNFRTMLEEHITQARSLEQQLALELARLE